MARPSKLKVKIPRKKLSKYELNEWRELGKSLKKNGLLKMDFRHRFTPQRMGVVKRVFQQNRDYIAHLNSPHKYVKRKVKNIEKFKELGYQTYHNNVMIPLDGFLPSQVHVKNGQVHRVSKGMEKHSKLIPPNTIIQHLKELSQSKEQLKPGEYATVRIAGKSAFSIQKMSYGELLKYVMAWQPKDDKSPETRDKLIAEMEVVKIIGDWNIR